MTLDVSLEAIEADLRIAERGGQVATLAMARAQVRATLLAASSLAPMVAADGHSLAIDDHQGRHEERAPYGALARAGTDIEVAEGAGVHFFTVPDAAAWDDRVTAAAMLLRLDEALLSRVLKPTIVEDAPAEEDARAGEPEEEPPAEDGDMDADFFAEARKARRKK
jgi:hypothetical protein